jgi:hypothetical protein
MRQERIKGRVIEYLTGNERLKRLYPDTPVDRAWHCVGIRSEVLAEFNEWMENGKGGRCRGGGGCGCCQFFYRFRFSASNMGETLTGFNWLLPGLEPPGKGSRQFQVNI